MFVPRTSSADDDNGHGSHVAGTVAAKNDGIGVVGVAAGAELVAVKVLDRRGSGSYDGVIAGIDYVANTAASDDVANMSLGGPTSDALDAAIIAAANKGIKFALAAGNESSDANNSSPARVNHSNVFTISAMGENDAWAYFSNYGNPPVDYCQPGVNIYSTYKSGGYTTMSGTSMASPHMAGLLLLGNTITNGTVNGDPDGAADPILVYNGTVTPPPPPDNVAPEADFTWSASELTVNFTDASSDTDGNVVAWNWNFGDESSSTLQNPTRTYTAAGTYTVVLTVTDDDGATGTVSKSVTVSSSQTSDISLSASVRKVRGVRYVDFVWSGATGTQVNIKMNGAVQETVTNDGAHTIDYGRLSGTFVFQVCETDDSACSNEVTLAL